ncbi:MAG: hypothetical protein AAFY57_03310 [Cyanobacteria bacterium J06642_2]
MTADIRPSPEEDFKDFKQRLDLLQSKYNDLHEFSRLESLPPEQLTDMQEQLMTLETRMNTYLSEFVSLPAIFWQAVRWGGLGLLLGIALQRWLGS